MVFNQQHLKFANGMAPLRGLSACHNVRLGEGDCRRDQRGQCRDNQPENLGEIHLHFSRMEAIDVMLR